MKAVHKSESFEAAAAAVTGTREFQELANILSGVLLQEGMTFSSAERESREVGLMPGAEALGGFAAGSAGEENPACAVPGCGGRTVRHGRGVRTVTPLTGPVTVMLTRVRCTACGADRRG